MPEAITTLPPIKKGNFFIARIKKFQVISFTFGFLLLNQILVVWATYLSGKEKLFDSAGVSIVFVLVGLPLLYFLQWLLVVWVASRFTKEKLKAKFWRHPIATIILFLLLVTDLPYRLSGYWGNLASVFEVIIYYSFVSFLWWLLICWISEKIFKQQHFQWNWYKTIVDKVFLVIPPLYKLILGLLVALFICIMLFLLISLVFHYSGSDLKKLFK
jgi:hypothetical protein